MSTTAIKLKKSSVVGKSPTDSDLIYGELAINYADGRLYYKSSSNVIKNFIDSDLVDSAVASRLSGKLDTTGGTLTGPLSMSVNRITDLATPIVGTDATTKTYVDNAIEAGIEGILPATFPTGDYGTVDSAVQIDAFGISFGATILDCLTQPVNELATVDLGTDSSI
jgi:hypothetical protein